MSLTRVGGFCFECGVPDGCCLLWSWPVPSAQCRRVAMLVYLHKCRLHAHAWTWKLSSLPRVSTVSTPPNAPGAPPLRYPHSHPSCTPLHASTPSNCNFALQSRKPRYTAVPVHGHSRCMVFTSHGGPGPGQGQGEKVRGRAGQHRRSSRAILRNGRGSAGHPQTLF